MFSHSGFWLLALLPVSNILYNVIFLFYKNDLLFLFYRKPAAKLEYYISPTVKGNYIDEDDLEKPTSETLKITLQNQVPGLKVVETPLIPKAASSEPEKKVVSVELLHNLEPSITCLGPDN